MALGMALGGCQSPPPPSQTVQVQRVISGNSLEVLLPNQGNQLRQVRLIGLDAPSPQHTPWGSEARRYLQTLIGQNAVRLELDTQPQDGYQRILAYVWVQDQLLNETLLRAGHALAEPQVPNLRYETRLRRAQEAARLEGIGLWNPEQPMRQTPDEFRQQRR